MSAFAAELDRLDREIQNLGEKRFLDVMETALYVGMSAETVRRALRSGAMHGSQPGGKGGSWKVRAACAEAWADGVPCPHQVHEKPVSLDEYRLRAAGARS